MTEPIREKQPERKVKPGDTVVSKENMEYGPATATFVSHSGGIAYLVWGTFGKMRGRKYAIVRIDDLILVED